MKILLHLGPPKAASTSLQDGFFSRLEEPDYFAGKAAATGIRTPLYRCLSEAVQSPPRRFRLERSRERIERELYKLRHVRTLVLSDEMFLVDTSAGDWQSKVARLGELLSGHEVILMLIAREPIRAAYSLFVELWNTFPRQERDLARFLLSSNQARIYNYGYLDELLRSSFPAAQRRYHSFEGIVAQGGFESILRQLALTVPSENGNQRLNPKERGRRGYVSAPPSLRTELVRHRLVRSLMAVIPRQWYAGAAEALERIPISRVAEVDFPSPELVTDYYSTMQRDLRDFERRTGIEFAWCFDASDRPVDG